MNNAQELSNVLSCGATTLKDSVQQQLPAMISVESVDQPDVKTVHVYGAQIPYTLTMRNRDESNLLKINKNFDGNLGSILKVKTSDKKVHRKSLELVINLKLFFILTYYQNLTFF